MEVVENVTTLLFDALFYMKRDFDAFIVDEFSSPAKISNTSKVEIAKSDQSLKSRKEYKLRV